MPDTVPDFGFKEAENFCFHLHCIFKEKTKQLFTIYSGSDGYRYPSTDTVSVKMTKIVSVSVSALKFFCIRIRIRPEIFLYPYPYPFFNFFVFVSVSVSVINSKFIWIFFGARFIKSFISRCILGLSYTAHKYK